MDCRDRRERQRLDPRSEIEERRDQRAHLRRTLGGEQLDVRAGAEHLGLAANEQCAQAVRRRDLIDGRYQVGDQLLANQVQRRAV